MESCEICGEDKQLIKAIVEGSLLNVCESCAKFGSAIFIKKVEQEQKPLKKLTTELINIINPDYPKLIKEAREKLNSKQKDLALKINEKESLIHKLETGSLQPTILLARKLEKVLKINLVELYEEKHEALNLKDEKLTIGDLLKLRK